MINFFRKIRRKLFTENKFTRYLFYAIGEIILVVIGILIALQINNRNQEVIQEAELDGLKKSIASAIRSDVKYLKLIRTGREGIGRKTDSIFNGYLGSSPKPDFEFNDYAFIANTFDDLRNTIYYQPNRSAFESLKNSIYLSKLRGTDIELLLNSFYAAAERIQKQEEEYNQALNNDARAWSNKFRNKNADLFMRPWAYLEEPGTHDKFMNILNDEDTKNLLVNGFAELDMTDLYDQQIIIGEKYIEMVEEGEVHFDPQTKIEFSGTFYSYAEIDVLNILIDGKIPSDFGMLYAKSGTDYYRGITFEEDFMILSYPENKYLWGSPLFIINALNNRVNEMDFSKYKNVTLEMKGADGGEQFFIAVKDKFDGTDGTESRADITVTNNWKKYTFPLDHFKTADKSIIEVPLAFIFVGDEAREIHVRSIQFK